MSAERSAAQRQRPVQRGGFAMGLVAGLLVGLAIALAVALYITKAPVPFVNKVPQRTAEQDNAETERNKGWDPNALLGGKPVRPAGAASGAVAVASAPVAASQAVAGANPPAPAAASSAVPARGSARDPAAILAGAPTTGPAPRASDAFIFFVQAGAYTRNEDAEQQRARLAMLGQEARVSEREQAGRVVYRVRLGPYASREDADGVQGKLQEQQIEAQIVRVEKP